MELEKKVATEVCLHYVQVNVILKFSAPRTGLKIQMHYHMVI